VNTFWGLSGLQNNNKKVLFLKLGKFKLFSHKDGPSCKNVYGSLDSWLDVKKMT